MSSVESRGGGIQKAVAELSALAQQAKQMGNDDHESQAIEAMIKMVLHDRLNPNQAVQKAREIIDGKDEI